MTQLKLTTEIVCTTDRLDSLQAAWTELQALAAGGNPFARWPWFRHWWELCGRARGLRCDQLHIHVQRDDRGKVRAILPFVVTTIGSGRLALRKLRLFGAVPRSLLTELPQILVWPGWESASAAEFNAQLYQHRRMYHWCELEGLPMGESLADAFLSGLDGARLSAPSAVPYYTLPLPESWDSLRGTLKPHMKKTLRNSYAALARDGHRWRLDTVEEPSGLDAALREFWTLHRLRSRSARGPSHSDHFVAPQARALIRDAGRSLLVDGGFRICRLRIGETVVASRLVFVTPAGFYLYHSGFDPAWWRYSVSTVLAAECIKSAIAARAPGVNLSTGRDASKLRWRPREHLVGNVRIISSTHTGRSVATTLAALRTIRERLTSPWRGRADATMGLL